MKASPEQAPAPLPEHVAAMETALKLLHAVGRVAVDAPATEHDLAPLARAVERAISAVLDAYDVRRDPVEAIRDGIQACDEIESLLAAAARVDAGLADTVAWPRAARDWLRVPEQRFAALRLVAPPPREIVASRDEPTLQRLARATLPPRFDVAKPLAPKIVEKTLADDLAKLPPKDRIKALKEGAKKLREEAALRRDERERKREEARQAAKARDAEEPPPGYLKGRHVARTPQAFVRDKARELFEDVCAMGLQRTPQLGDYWRGSSVFDQRMLRDVDAIASLGGEGLAAVEPLVVDAPAKDPSRAFAIAMVLGCFEGRDALAAVERAIRFLGPTQAEVRGFAAAALKIAPHPEIGTVARRWLEDEDAGMRALGIEVLAHRGLATADELSRACRDAAEDVAASAFLGAALADVPELGALIEERAESKHGPLLTALGWATVLGSVSYPIDRLKKRLGGEDAASVLLPFALAADETDAPTLVEAFVGQPTRSLANALGYLGSPRSLPLLVDILEREAGPELHREVAFALQRITGAELYEDVGLAPEHVDVELPEAPPVPGDAPKLTRMTSDRRDKPSAGSPDRIKLPTIDPAVWRAYLETERVRFEGDRRMRRGQPYTPAASFVELDTYQITPAERRILYREIVVKTGKVVPFDPVDFVAVQERALSKLAAVAEKGSAVPGSWGKAARD